MIVIAIVAIATEIVNSSSSNDINTTFAAFSIATFTVAIVTIAIAITITTIAITITTITTDTIAITTYYYYCYYYNYLLLLQLFGRIFYLQLEEGPVQREREKERQRDMCRLGVGQVEHICSTYLPDRDGFRILDPVGQISRADLPDLLDFEGILLGTWWRGSSD